MRVDSEVRDRIAEVVREWVDQGKMFTAFEVSLAVKERGVEERHRHLRDTVHDVIFEIGGPMGYTRTLRDVGAPQQAWVYHLPSDNPYRYVPLDRSSSGQKAADVVDVALPLVIPVGVKNPISLQTIKTTPAIIPDSAYGTDQYGRVCIPLTLVARLGVAPGQQVHVTCSLLDGKVTITRPDPSLPLDPDTTYTIEPDGNIRIPQGTLEKAGIDGLQTYRIEGNASQITVSKFDWE